MERRLLQKVETFLKEADMPPTVFGRAAVRDPRLVSDLRNGREPGRRVTARAELFMSQWRRERQKGHVAPRGDRRTRAGRAEAGERA